MRPIGLLLYMAIITSTALAKPDTIERLLQALATRNKKTESLHNNVRDINEASCGINKYMNQKSKKSTNLETLLAKILKVYAKAEDLDARILNGIPARPGEFPWMALIGMNPFQTNCGASLITAEWIVTAAHCMYSTEADGLEFIGERYQEIGLFLGEHNINENTIEPYETRVLVEKVIVHASYDVRDPNIQNDIALIKLQKPVTFNMDVAPICIPMSAIPIGTKCYASGWGINKNDQTSEILRTVELQILGKEDCETQRDGDILYPGTLCAAKLPGVDFADACSGDSGGPLSCLIDGIFYLAGATSYGVDCTMGLSVPGVYTDIFYFKQWIEDNIAQNSWGKSASGGGDNGRDNNGYRGGTGGYGGGTGGYGGGTGGYGGGTGGYGGDDNDNGEDNDFGYKAGSYTNTFYGVLKQLLKVLN